MSTPEKNKNTYNDMFKKIEHDVRNRGFSTTITGDIVEKDLIALPASTKGIYGKMTDVIIHTVGFSDKGFSEFMFMLGPAYGELPASQHDILIRIKAIEDTIPLIYSQLTKNGSPRIGARIGTPDSRQYVTSRITENTEKEMATMFPVLSDYYKDRSYKVAWCIPEFSEQFSLFQNYATKTIN